MNRDEFEKITERLLDENDRGEKQVIKLLTKNGEFYIILNLIEEITTEVDGYKIDLADGSHIQGDYKDVTRIVEVV